MDYRSISKLNKGNYINLDGCIYVIDNITYVRNRPRWFLLEPLIPSKNPSYYDKIPYKAHKDSLLKATQLDETCPALVSLKVLYGQKEEL